MSFEIRKYGAIDIGSNAIRLLIATVTLYNEEPPVFKKTSLVRVPIRLGQDVFTTGNISQENISRMVNSMKSYQLLMDVHKVKTYQAYATSAMREAQNGKEVVQQIEKESGIQIDIIDGSHEAAIIAMTDLHASLEASKVFLYVDVGGGSTEFTVFAYGNAVVSKSFKIGTVRLLNDMVNKTLWDEAERWIKEVTSPYEQIDLIGSGGNINNIFKSSGKGV
ncbi:MAG: exopolyphosphatase/guanosine-5'-triphosphate,3'-diphosphate pyrophosphatase, partial [Nonlabens sp.]